MLIFGLCILVVADLVLAEAAGVAALVVGVLFWGLHMGFTQGLFAALVADTAPVDRRGTAFGLVNLVSGLAHFGASVIAGALWDAHGAESTFFIGAILANLALMALPPVRTGCAECREEWAHQRAADPSDFRAQWSCSSASSPQRSALVPC